MSFVAIRAAIAATALGLGTLSQAAVLVHNPPDRVGGDNMSIYKVADNFTLGGGTYDITGFSFASLQLAAGDYSGALFWAVYSDVGGAPGAVLQSGTANPAGVAGPTGVGPLGLYSEFSYTVSGLNFTLASGTYWLALENDSDGSPNFTDMLWGSSASGAAPAGKYFDFGLNGWVDSEFEHAFTIDGDRQAQPPGVPVPSSLALLAGALLVAGARRRRPART